MSATSACCTATLSSAEFAVRVNGIAAGSICASISADSLAFVTLDALVGATQQKKEHLCRACFDGVYPVELPAEDRIGKSVLEGIARRVENSAGGGANDALKRV